MRPLPQRSGFTLLEVLLALALASVLLTAVWASLDLFYRYSDAGREEADRLQVTRALFQALDRDLRSAIQPPETPPTTAATSSTNDSSSTSSQSTTGGSTTSTSSSSSASGGTGSSGSSSSTPPPNPIVFIGDAEAFIFQSLLPQSLEQASLAAAATGSSGFRRDLQWVGWSATGKLPTNLPSGTSLPPPPLQEEIDGRPQVVRWQTDVLGDSSEASAPPPSFPIPPEVVPELLRFHLRYFDGAEWVEKWDSQLDKGLPLAVEIEVDIASYAEVEAVRESKRQFRPRDAEFKTHKTVIPLPVKTGVRPPAASTSL